MNTIIELWDRHGTKLLGTAASVVSTAMLIPELIPAGHLKYWLFANALLGDGKGRADTLIHMIKTGEHPK